MTDFTNEENEITPEENIPDTAEKISEAENETATEEKTEEKPKEKEPFISSVYDFLEVMGVTISIVVVLFSFVLRFAGVSGNSMYDTYYSGDSVIMVDLGYTPKSGDVVVIHQATSYFNEPLIKRVIATSGQKISINFSTWTVYVDDEKLNEDYVTRNNGTMDSDDYYTMYADMFDESGNLVIPEGYCFVMGDNRNHSSDSRFSGVGLVKNSEVVGKAVLRIKANGGND